MSFKWLNSFQQEMKKPDNYAEKSLAAYKLGMKAKGSIAGVKVTVDPQGCTASQELNPDAIYHPDEAPRLPLLQCDRNRKCRCVYRPVMTYQIKDDV